MTPTPPPALYGPLAAVLAVVAIAGLVAGNTAGVVVLVIGAIALMITGRVPAAEKVPDPEARRLLIAVQITAVLLAFAVGALVDDDLYVGVAAIVFLLATLLGRFVVGAAAASSNR